MNPPHIFYDLVKSLKLLGIAKNDVIFVHSSFKRLGTVEGGASTVIKALSKVVGPNGLILMPSFNLVAGSNEVRSKGWDILTTPSTVGWLTECFRLMPNTFRSDHYSHSVAALGYDAEQFISGHLHNEGYKSPWDLKPWGKTYGVESPMHKAYTTNGKLLMLGVNYDSSTYMHFIEVLCWNKMLAECAKAAYPRINRMALGAFWDRVGSINRAFVGNADSRLFIIKEYVDTLYKEFFNNPTHYLTNTNA